MLVDQRKEILITPRKHAKRSEGLYPKEPGCDHLGPQGASGEVVGRGFRNANQAPKLIGKAISLA
jgi:hypothetical protein